MASLEQAELQVTALRVLYAYCCEWLLANGKEDALRSFFSNTYPRPTPGCAGRSPTAGDFNSAIANLLATGYQPPGSWNTLGPSNIEHLTPEIEAAILEHESLRAKLLGTPPAKTEPSEGEGAAADHPTPSQPTMIVNNDRSVNIYGPVQGSNVAGSNIADSSASFCSIDRIFDVGAESGRAPQATRWERLNKWAFNNRLVVAILAVSAVVGCIVELGPRLASLVGWIRRFMAWLWP